jgi:haloalkane dehalogenase
LEATVSDGSYRYETVLGLRMAYREEGTGDPILLLHGNPTSSYLWRQVIPHLAPLGRVIAPDLIGMGRSDKLPVSGPGSYRFAEHRTYLDAFVERLGLAGEVVLVGHDWGGALAFDWARRHPASVRGIAHMEAIIGPRSWSEVSEELRQFLQRLRSPDGEELVLNHNVFVERLPAVTLHLTDDDLKEYRAPFLTSGESRRPTLTWPRELPFDGEPSDVHADASAWFRWMEASGVPKLLISAEPGAIVTGPVLARCRRWSNQTEVSVHARHFVPEDAGDEVGKAVAAWMIERLADDPGDR